MGLFYYDSTMLILLPALIFTLIAQAKVSGTFNKYSKVKSVKGYTGADAAKLLLAQAGIHDVSIEPVKGNLTDHYDPKAKVLRLSETVYGSSSIAALGVAAHETGHAIQHNEGYMPLTFRNNLLPAVMIGSNMAIPLIIIGLILGGLAQFGIYIAYFGIALFAIVVLFQLVTLPVEFDASNRAVALLQDNSLLTTEESGDAKKVLNAAALTYVAAAATAIANLLRFFLMANRRRD